MEKFPGRPHFARGGRGLSLRVQNSVFPMFVGCGRSGTTLFRNIFNAHPDLAVTHEAHFIGPMAAHRKAYQRPTGFAVDEFIEDLLQDPNFVRQGVSEAMIRSEFATVPPGNFSDAVRGVFGAYARSHDKTLYGDKTPGSVSHIEVLGDLFPEAKFVHIIRDGRNVALSYLERPEWGPQTIQEAAHHWKNRVVRGQKAGATLGAERYTEVRYEDLVESPETVTRSLCGFLGLDYDEEMLRYHVEGEEFIARTRDPAAFENLAKPVTKGLREWRDQIAADDLVMFESIAGDLLNRLGYEVTNVRRPVSMRLRATLSMLSWQKKRVLSFTSRKLRGRRDQSRQDPSVD